MGTSPRPGQAGHAVSLGHPPGRMAFLAGLGAVLGAVGGAAAVVVVKLVGLVSNLALLHQVGFALPDLAHYRPGAALVGVAVAGALAVVGLTLWTPVIKGHGIPESLEAIVRNEGRIRPRVVVAKPLSAAIAMGTGGPFGAEGPIIVTGSGIGSLLGQVLAVSAAERRILLATGAAAGMAGIFATPVAAVVMAFELLLFERSLRALLPLVFACGIATELHDLLLGAAPLFAAHGLHRAGGDVLPLYAVLGVAAGLLAVILNRGLFAWEAAFRHLPLAERWHPVLGAVGFGLIGLAVPGSLSVGYWAISDAVNGRFLAGGALVLCVGKLASWWIALASNTSGGTLAPMFLIAATMGEAVGIGFSRAFPALGVQPAAFALVAMGATFGAGARALLTGGVFALEVTGAYPLVVPMLICLGVAELVAGWLLEERIMTDKLARRGIRVELDSQADPFAGVAAGQVMDPLPGPRVDPRLPVIGRGTPLSEALGLFVSSGADQVAVEEDGRPVGLLARSAIADVLARRLGEAVRQPPTLRPARPGRGVPRCDEVRQENQGSHDMDPHEHRPPRRFGDQDYRDILEFRDRLRRFLAWSEAQCRAAGLTASQHQLLLAVRGHPGPLAPTIGDVAGHLQLRHHSAVGLVDRAEAAGLVSRVPDPDDRRVVRIRLEPAGEEALEELTALHLTELAVLAEASAAFRPPRFTGTPQEP